MTEQIASVGDMLKTAREARGITIESVAREICVRSSYLRDIEDGHLDRLPEAAFSVGFVRAYARMLALDSDSAVAAFKEELGVAQAPKIDLQSIEAAIPRRRGMPGWLSPVAGLVGVSVCWFMLGGNLASLGITTPVTAPLSDVAVEKAQLAAVKAMLPRGELAETGAPATAPAAATATAEATALPLPAEDTSEFREPRSLFMPAAHASSGGKPAMGRENDIRLEATEDAWVRLANTDGSELWSGILRQGQTYRPQHEGDLLLTTSNAGGLLVSVGLGEARLLGNRGEVLSDVRLGKGQQFSTGEKADAAQAGSR